MNIVFKLKRFSHKIGPVRHPPRSPCAVTRRRLNAPWPYRDTSLRRKRHSVGPYSRTMPRRPWWYSGGVAVSYARGNPVGEQHSLTRGAEFTGLHRSLLRPPISGRRSLFCPLSLSRALSRALSLPLSLSRAAPPPSSVFLSSSSEVKMSGQIDRAIVFSACEGLGFRG